MKIVQKQETIEAFPTSARPGTTRLFKLFPTDKKNRNRAKPGTSRFFKIFTPDFPIRAKPGIVNLFKLFSPDL